MGKQEVVEDDEGVARQSDESRLAGVAEKGPKKVRAWAFGGSV